jgi:hypothetical protein
MTYFNKTSALVSSQLPKFISDDPNYSTFVLFLQAYYEWMEEQGGATYGAKNIPNYYDIDKTLDSFLDHFRHEFLAFFPQGALVDERKLIKIAKELYKTKGTPASFEFLFRVLYDSDVQLFNTSDYVFRASDGKWTITKSVKLATSDTTWFNSIGYRVFGLESRAYATIESVNIINSNSLELILTTVQNNFISGEYVVVQDDRFNNIIFNNNILTAEILGVISAVTVNPAYKGAGYVVGDPVVFYGGLDPNTASPIGASATIGAVSTAGIGDISASYPGHGYRSSFTDIQINSPTGAFAAAVLSTTDGVAYPVNWIGQEVISSIDTNQHLNIGTFIGFANNVIANANSKLSTTLTYPTLTTYGIGTILITIPGQGYEQSTTSANALGTYLNSRGGANNLVSLGILAPINIVNGGTGYQLLDKIIFTGGGGVGANAYVTGCGAANGTITQISYRITPNLVTPLGGMGYTGLPALTVNSSNVAAYGAILQVPGFLGADAILQPNTTISGEVTQINISEYGQNYISSPSASLRVEDILVYNNNPNNTVKSGDKIYQYANGSSKNVISFIANVESLILVSSNAAGNNFYSNYNLRVYDYSGASNTSNPLIVLRNDRLFGANLLINTATSGIYTTGRKIYGNGQARAQVSFSQGVQYGQGVYLNSDGQPSSYSVLQNEDYNDFTYFLKVEKALSEYKDTALAFLHPAGLHYKTFNTLLSSNAFNTAFSSQEISSNPLAYLLGAGGATFRANVANTQYSNTIVFNNLSGAQVNAVVTPGSFLTLYTDLGSPYTSNVRFVTSNTVTLQTPWVTSVPNVAYATSDGTNQLNIVNTTTAWTVATGNTYTFANTFINPGDNITYNGNTGTVIYSDPLTIQVLGATFGTGDGYVTLTRNVVTGNVWVTEVLPLVETIELDAETGQVLTTEDNNILLLG